MNIIICIVFGAVIAVTVYDLGKVGNQTASVIKRDVSKVIENARLGRELYSVFEKNGLLTRTFFNSQKALEKEGTEIILKLSYIIEKNGDEELESALRSYYDHMILFLEQCGIINESVEITETYNKSILEMLNILDAYLADSIIEMTLKGEDISTIEQLTAMMPSFRETMFNISLKFARIKPLRTDTREVTPIVGILDDLHLRLKTLLASDEAIARQAQKLMDTAIEYKDAVIRFNNEMIELKTRFIMLEAVKDKAIILTDRKDYDVLNTADLLREETGVTVRKSIRFILSLSAAVIIAIALFTYYFFFKTIREPMTSILNGIELFRKGNLKNQLELKRNDEWRVIELALNRMADDLGKSYENLELNKNEVERLYKELKRNLNELEAEMMQRELTEAALVQNEQKHRTVLEASPDPVAVHDTNELVTYINPAFTRIFGWTPDEILNTKLAGFVPHHSQYSNRIIQEKIKNGEVFSGIESKRYTKNGEIRDVSISGAGFFDSKGDLLGNVITYQDITHRKKTEEEISYMAYHDTLTGLMNRKSFYLRLDEVMNQAKRQRNRKWAVMMLDLDRFKYINDTLGHEFGDELLILSAVRLKKCLRKSDHIFRLGGDEFTIILSNIHSATDIAKVAVKIREEIAKPYLIKETEIYNSVSIGISVYPDDGEEIEVLVKNADIAMYAAKDDVQGYRFFTEEMNTKAIERMKLESSLRNALQENEFHLNYQPLVNDSGNIIGLEALLRWVHPTLGVVSPTQFIPIAEETGAIVTIGKWVLDMALKQAKEWHDKGFDHLFIAVNLSTRQLKEPDLVETVQKIIAEVDFDPKHLKLEVTESGIMEEPEDAIAKMKQLREKGIRFSIDDFGTGYSSLSYLKRFPIDTLKIDRSFVMDSMQNRDDREIIKTIIAMAKNLNIETVAEGVETKEQQDFLKGLGCRMMQGYFFGKPMSAFEIETVFDNWGKK